MREKLLALVDLQKVDMEVASLRKAAEVWPKQLAELEKELASAQSAVEAERNRVLDLESQKRTLEQTISEEKEKVKKWEQRLAEQRSTREYSALAREIDIAKKATLTMQEEVVELGKQLAAAREAVTARVAETSGTRQRIDANITELRTKVESSESQIAALNVKREEEATKVDPALLRRYDTVRKKRMPAMVAVVNGRCTGCNMNIPPQLNYLLHASRGTDVCPSCNRIIHAAEALEPKPES